MTVESEPLLDGSALVPEAPEPEPPPPPPPKLGLTRMREAWLELLVLAVTRTVSPVWMSLAATVWPLSVICVELVILRVTLEPVRLS